MQDWRGVLRCPCASKIRCDEIIFGRDVVIIVHCVYHEAEITKVIIRAVG